MTTAHAIIGDTKEHAMPTTNPIGSNLYRKAKMILPLAHAQGRIKEPSMAALLGAARREIGMQELFIRDFIGEPDAGKSLWWFCILVAREEFRRPCGAELDAEAQELVSVLAGVLR